MPTFDITGPDGTHYEVTGPEGSTEAQALERVRAQHGAKPEPTLGQQVKQQAGNLAAGVVRGAGSIGATLLAPIDAAARAVNGGKPINVGGYDIAGQDRRAGMDAGLTDLGADTNSLAFMGGKLAGEIAGTAGAGGAVAQGIARAAPLVSRAAPNALMAIQSSGLSAGNATGATNALLRVGGGAVSGGASAALIDPTDVAAGAGIGAALPAGLQSAGKVGQVVGSKAASVLRGSGVSPEVQALAARAKELGIEVPADRLVDSKPLNATAAALNYVPFSGRAATETRMNQQLNTAASRLIGQDTPNMTKALRDAGAALGAKFDDTLQGNTLKMTPDFRQALAEAENRATAELAPTEAAIIHRQIADIQAKGASGAIDGQAAYNIKKTLDRIATRNSNEAFYAQDLKRDLMTALNDSLGPAEAQAFAQTRQQYGNMLALEKLAKNGAEGEISVARLANLKNINNQPLQELADIAAQFVRPREGQHGAAQRAAAGALTFGLAGAKGLVAGAALGRGANAALNSNKLRELMLDQTPGIARPAQVNRLLQLGVRAAPAIEADR